MNKSDTHTQLTYRPEIDGLRALAVLAVICYHAQFTYADQVLVPGGFLGVDVFFVISGYLISSIILKEISGGGFSFKNFYDRRARRILPALYLVMLVSLVAGWRYIFPQPFVAFTDSIRSSLLFSSNFYFFQENAYTAEASALKPFLHTWSLSVEEQFYFIFPPLLVFLYRTVRQKLLIAFIATLTLTSFGIAYFYGRYWPNFNFYLLPARLWELFAGLFLAWIEAGKISVPDDFKDERLRHMLGCLGLSLIFYGFLQLEDSMIHPGPGTLIPVVGTMLLIFGAGGNRDKFLVKILSSGLLVGTGVISYSLYLWHQPVFAFFRIRYEDSGTNFERFLLVLISMAAATASYFLVEKRFRDKSRTGKNYIWVLGAIFVFIFSFATYNSKHDGMISRFPPFVTNIASAAEDFAVKLKLKGSPCIDRYVSSACHFGLKTGPKWYLAGDSHLATFSGELIKKINLDVAEFIPLNWSACPFIPGTTTFREDVADSYCKQFNEERSELFSKVKNSVIFMGGRMPVYLSGRHFNNREGGNEGDTYVYTGAFPYTRESPERVQLLKSQFNKIVRRLLARRNKIVLIYPVPEVGWHVPKTLFKRTMSGQLALPYKPSDYLSTSYDLYLERTRETYEMYGTFKNDPNVLAIYPEKLFCNTEIPGRCLANNSEDIFYADTNHLSNVGLKKLSDEIVAEIRKKWPQLKRQML